MRRGLASAALAALGAGGCAGTAAPLSPEQLSAIQTVEIDSPRDEVFRAAAGVMIDDGLIVTMSDYGAGLLSAGPWAPVGGSTYAGLVYSHGACPGCSGGGHIWCSGGLVVWVRPDGPRRSLLRVALTQPEPVRRFADEVRERCLASAPPEASR